MREKRFKYKKKKIIIGLTGTFGSGKTTVAKIFKAEGAKIIDADKIAHEVIKPGTKVYKRIVKAFGKVILKGNRAINRKKLGDLVFGSKLKLAQLNKITHPQVIRMIKQRIKGFPARPVILDAPLLLEAGLKKIADRLIVVKIRRKEQIRRIRVKFGLKEEEILRRIRSQIPLSVKVRLADFVIDNSGTLKETRKQARHIRRQLWKN